MVYSNKFVMCVLINGEVQREKANGVVPILFNSEYVLRFRNKNNRRAVVQIFLDGENVSGGGYIIGANSSVDIRRHSDKDCAFKFVSLDSPDAVEHGKNGPNDDNVKGTVEARFFLEKEYRYRHVEQTWCMPKFITGDYTCDNGELKCTSKHIIGRGFSGAEREMKTCGSLNMTYGNMSTSHSTPDTMNFECEDGCTVEGKTTGQNFYKVNIDIEDNYTAVKLFLQGYESELQQAIKASYCDKCGAAAKKKNSAFCHICGTKL